MLRQTKNKVTDIITTYKTRGTDNSDNTYTSGYGSTKQMPFIGMLDTKQQFVVLFISIIVCLSIALSGFWYSGYSNTNNLSNKNVIKKLLLLSLEQKNLLQKYPNINQSWIHNFKENKVDLNHSLNSSTKGNNFLKQQKYNIGKKYETLNNQFSKLLGQSKSLIQINHYIANMSDKLSSLNQQLSNIIENRNQNNNPSISNLKANANNINFALNNFYKKPSYYYNDIQNNLKSITTTLNSHNFNSLAHQYNQWSQGYVSNLKKIIQPIQHIDHTKKNVLSQLNLITNQFKKLNSVFSSQNNNLSEIIICISAIASFLALCLIYALGRVYYISYNNTQHLSNQRQALTQKGLKGLIKESQYLGQGYLNKQYSQEGGDADQLVQELNKNIKDLNNLLQPVKSDIKQSYKTIEELNNAAQNYIDLTDQQNNKILEVSEEVLTLASRIFEITEKSNEVQSLISKTNEESKNGKKYTESLNSVIVDFGKNVEDSQEKYEKLQESYSRVVEFVNQQQELVEEINMLSVNASIQSAKHESREQGFDIIAQKIKKLARKSSNYMNKTQSLIRNTQHDLDSVKKSIDKNDDLSKQMANLSYNENNALDNIVSNHNLLTKNNNNINEKINDQSKNAETISENTQQFIKNIEAHKEAKQYFEKTYHNNNNLIRRLYQSIKSIKL